MLEERKKWIKTRFGGIDERVLGRITDVKEISWPELIEEYTVRDEKRLLFKLAGEEIEDLAERIAEIYRNGIDEMSGNSEYDWHHSPAAIIERCRGGDWNFIVCYYGDQIIMAGSLNIIRGHRTVQLVWACVDPVFRGIETLKPAAQFADMVIEGSGAQVGSVSAVTHHPYTQMAVEAVGYKPVGCCVGGSFYGGSDGKYYRPTVIWYLKHYRDTPDHVQPWEGMKLWDQGKGKKLAEFVQQLWEED